MLFLLIKALLRLSQKGFSVLTKSGFTNFGCYDTLETE